MLKSQMMKIMYKLFNIRLLTLIIGMSLMTLSSCYDVKQRASEEDSDKRRSDSGVEYAPQMYHSEAYDPMSQIEDKESGLNYWPFNYVGTSAEMGGTPHGEWYNSNYWNPYGMNMRQPATGTVMRGITYFHFPDSVDVNSDNGRNYSNDYHMNPMAPEMEMQVSETGDTSMVVSASSDNYLADGKELFTRFCSHCHGKAGMGDGPVADPKKFAGVASLQSAAMTGKKAGYVYHVITHGKNNMRSHAAQLDEVERWKIAEYVIRLKK